MKRYAKILLPAVVILMNSLLFAEARAFVSLKTEQDALQLLQKKLFDEKDLKFFLILL